MLKIKLARFGKRGQPFYRVVVNEARDKRDGKYIEKVGHYAPTQQPKLLDINVERFKFWLSKGAQPTETVAALFERFQSGNPFPAKPARISKKSAAKTKAAAAAAAEAAANPVVEEVAPVVETAPESEVAPVEETKAE